MSENYIGNNTFAGPKGISVFALTQLAMALESYAKHKIICFRGSTPKKMMAAAERHTGKKFKPRDYEAAAAACRAKRDEVHAEVKTEMIVNRAMGRT